MGKHPITSLEAATVVDPDDLLYLVQGDGNEDRNITVALLTEALATDVDASGKVDKSTLTTDGDLYSRVAGAVARITRATLAADAAFTGAYKALTGRLSTINPTTGNPLVIAHRGGSNLHPENTMEAYQAAVAAGAKAIEADCYLLADGSLGVMHDATTDRTTTASGNTADRTAASWQALVHDQVPSGSSYTGLTFKPPLAEDVIREYGNRVFLVLEAKNTGSGAAIVALLAKHGVHPDCAMVESFTQSELTAAVSAGYHTMMLGAGLTPATVAAAGIGWIGFDAATANPDTYITAIAAADLKAAIYTIDRQWQRDLFTGYGAVGFFSDDPIYFSKTGYRRLTDPFAAATHYHGHLPSNGLDRGSYSGGRWAIGTAVGGSFLGDLMGWASPIAGNPTEDDFTIAYSIKFVAASGADRWCSVFLGTSDRQFNDGASTGVNGYHLLHRKQAASQLGVYKVTDGVATLLAAVSGTLIADGATATFLVTKTPTGITFARTDVAHSNAVTDSTHPGCGYLFMGRNGVQAEFSAITVTDT